MGKTTLINRLLEARPENVIHPVTHTTRPLRPGEVNGRDMLSIPRSQFTPRLLGGEYLAHTEYQGNYYGTLRQDILTNLAAGKKVIVAFDEGGIDCLRSAGFPAVVVWLAAPNRRALESWLTTRWQDKGPLYEARLSQAVREYARFEFDKEFRKKFDYWILSRDMAEMANEMLEIMGLSDVPSL